MSFKEKEKVKFASPLQSIFKNYRFFTRYKPQFGSTALQPEFLVNHQSFGSSHIKNEQIHKNSSKELRRSRSNSQHFEENCHPQRSTLQNNFYNYQSPLGQGVSHVKKTSIDLDHSLKKSMNALLHFSKRMKSNKPQQPGRKLDSFINLLPNSHKFYHTMHKSNRNTNFKSLINQTNGLPNMASTFDENLESEKRQQEVKNSLNKSKQTQFGEIPENINHQISNKEEETRNNFIVQRDLPIRVQLNTSSFGPSRHISSLSKDTFVDICAKNYKRESIKRASAFNPKNFKLGGKNYPLFNNQRLIAKTYENEMTKKHFYQNEKLEDDEIDFFEAFEKLFYKTKFNGQTEKPICELHIII